MHINHTKQKTTNKKYAFLLFFISYFFLIILYHIIIHHDIAADKERYAYIARNQAEHIITTIDCVMSRTNTLTTMVIENNGNTKWFNHVAEDLYVAVEEETGVSLKNFALAPNCVVSDAYPLKGNEQLIGFDFLDTNHAGNFEAKAAYENGKTIITNPFKLIQGGIGMGCRAPVFIQNDDSRTFWGLVTVTIDFENLMDVIGLNNLQGMGVDYSLSYIDSDGDAHFMYGNSKIGKKTVKTQFNVRNLTWELEVRPYKGWFSVLDGIISLIIIISLSCLAGLFTYILIRLRENNALLLKISTTDALTGCYNRRAYEDKIKELSSQKIDDDFVYVSADLNGLKQTNDTLGHTAGDELISRATTCLQNAFGSYGKLYRIGGDEFVALIYIKEESLAEIFANIDSIMNIWKDDNVNQMSISIGYASHREFPNLTIEELSKAADKKMYEEKQKYYQKHDRRRN